MCKTLSLIYASQISTFYLDKQKSGVFGHMQGPLCGPGVGLTHNYVHLCILLHMNSIQSKFQVSILINKISFKLGALCPHVPCLRHKGSFAGQRRVNSNLCISFYFIHAHQISAISLDKQKSRAFGPTQGPLCDHEGN